MMNLFRPIYFEPAKHVYKFFADGDYRSYWLLESKLRKIPRFTDCHADVHGWKLSIPDSASFLSAFNEIFLERIYAFKSETPSPRILDLGANIGLSVLFFKRLNPQAQIVAYEADPRIFEYLENNVHGNGYTDVRLINKAAWHENTALQFSSEGADGGRAALTGDGNLVDVEAVDIAEILKTDRFDFLKMDIEGAEDVVLPACRDYLGNVRYIFVEYHSRAGRKQCLDRIIGILSDAGFRIHLHSVMCSPSPFVKLKVHSGFDMQLNIFGWKE